MDHVEVFVRFDWRQIGIVRIAPDGKLVFPQTPNDPGLYRFDWKHPDGTATYIGETDQLSRRFQHYRTPGPSQRTNLRMNELMRNLLSENHQISAAVVTGDVSTKVGGKECEVSLNRKRDRVLLEHAALFQAHLAGITIINA